MKNPEILSSEEDNRMTLVPEIRDESDADPIQVGNSSFVVVAYKKDTGEIIDIMRYRQTFGRRSDFC